MTRIALPYLTPNPQLIEASDWLLTLQGEEVPLPEHLDEWDYNLDLSVRRVVTIDADAVREQCALPPDAPLAMSVVWHARGSGLRARAALVEVGEAKPELELALTIPGSRVSGTLAIDTFLILPRAVAHLDPIAPRRAGSVLWRRRSTLRLQGDGSQFPIALADFTQSSLPSAAGWHLEIDGPLDAAAMGSILLLVNSRHKVVATAFASAGKPRPTDKLVLSAVYSDVARTLVEYALTRDDFVDEAQFADESLGALLRDVFAQMFSGRSIRDVRLRAKDSPTFVATEVQASAGIFGGVA